MLFFHRDTQTRTHARARGVSYVPQDVKARVGLKPEATLPVGTCPRDRERERERERGREREREREKERERERRKKRERGKKRENDGER